MKKRLLLALRVLISVLLIVILLYIMRDKYGQILAAIKRTSIPLFIASLGVFTTAIAIASLRLKLIIEIQKIGITYLESLSLNFLGYFFNNFLPTSIGGDVVKAYYLSKKSPEKMPAFTAVFVDRVIGLFTMILIAFVALFFCTNNAITVSIKYLIYMIMLFTVGVFVFMTNKRLAMKFSGLLNVVKPLKEKLIAAYEMIHGYKHHTELMLRSFALSIASQLLFFISLGLLALSIGSKIPMAMLLLTAPLISALSLLPSINGLGLREGSTVVLFGPIIGKESAFAVSILWFVMLIIVSIAGGAIYGLSPQFHKINIKEIE